MSSPDRRGVGEGVGRGGIWVGGWVRTRGGGWRGWRMNAQRDFDLGGSSLTWIMVSNGARVQGGRDIKDLLCLAVILMM